MTNEEAIETIERIVTQVKDSYRMQSLLNGGDVDEDRFEKDVKAFEIAIEALEKQIPKKFATKTVDGFKGKYCPMCGLNHGLYIPNISFAYGIYCSKCGQRLEGVEDGMREL